MWGQREDALGFCVMEQGSPESITEIDPEDLEKLHALDAAAGTPVKP